MKLQVHTALEIAAEALVEKYLGLPTALGRSTDAEFEHIMSKVKRLVNRGIPRMLSSAGREVYIKSICQAIPTYSMSCFRLSKKLCKKLTSVIARFWCGGDEKKRKMHWRKWEEITIPKGEGGMGFRDLQLFNQSMLARQGWRLLTRPESLCARVLKGRYFHDCDFVAARKKRNSSHTWRAILHGREALNSGLIKRIGDGSTIKVWDVPWIPENHSSRPYVRQPEADVTRVEELIDQDTGDWDLAKIATNFVFPDVEAICRLPIGHVPEDTWAWKHDKHGNFTVRSAYKVLIHERRRNNEASSSVTAPIRHWQKLWKLPVPPKVRNFWWRVIHKFVPCRAVLQERHVEQIPFCEDCGVEETIPHALFSCTWAKLFWSELRRFLPVRIPSLHLDSWAVDIVDGKEVSEQHAAIILCGCWTIWTRRNNRRHGEQIRSVHSSVKWAIDTSHDLAALQGSKTIREPWVKSVWLPPIITCIKVNVDACYYEQEGHVVLELFFGTIAEHWFGHKQFGIDLHKMLPQWRLWRSMMAFVLL
jgi:hypothetical protein